jgi:cytochrome c-type biogenesis protein CcmE
MSFRPKALLLAALIVAAMAFLMYRTLGSEGATYYIEVQEFAQQPREGIVKLAGYVQEGSIEQAPGALSVRFAIVDEAREVSYPVLYAAAASGGRIPDTFQEGSQVVVTGELREDGAFHATQLLAKCPSKYEAADPAEHPTES